MPKVARIASYFVGCALLGGAPPIMAQAPAENAPAENAPADSAPRCARACAAQRQALDDAWWTGPMIAPSPGALLPGHFLIEPYLYDVRAGRSNSYGTLTY